MTIEDTEEILDFSIRGYDVLLWPILRYGFFLHQLNLLYQKNIISAASPAASTLGEPHPYRKVFFRYLPGLLSPWPKRDIWYLANTPRSRYFCIDGHYIDIYTDPYADTLPEQSLYISQSIYADKRIKKPCLSYKFIQSTEVLFEKFSKHLITTDDEKLVKNLINFLKARSKGIGAPHLGEPYWHKFELRAIRSIAIAKAQYRFYRFLFRHRKPKILILTSAFYGSTFGLAHLARDEGITTAEIQHGTVARTMPAYNWANALCQSATLKHHIVDYFLTYGAFWHDRLQIPAKCHEIGSAWFSRQSKRYKQSGEAILFCLQNNCNAFIPFIKSVAAHFPQKHIIVRHHPSYKELFVNSGIADIKNIIIDHNSDIYKTFSQASIVIGESSTALFEALALGKRVYVLGQSPVTKSIFSGVPVTYFITPEELLELIAERSTGKITPELQHAFFCPDWKQRYLAFLDKHLDNREQN